MSRAASRTQAGPARPVSYTRCLAGPGVLGDAGAEADSVRTTPGAVLPFVTGTLCKWNAGTEMGMFTSST